MQEQRKVIGSVRTGQVNYAPEHTFFNQTEHMFPKAQMVRTVVRDEIDKDILGTKSAKWNGSVALQDNVNRVIALDM